MKTLAILCLAFAAVFTGCNSTGSSRRLGIDPTPMAGAPDGTVTLPRLPPIADTGIRHDSTTVLAAIREHAPVAVVSLPDRTYAPFPLEWVQRAAPRLAAIAAAKGYRFTKESGDCDNWAEWASAILNEGLREAGIQAEGEVWQIHLQQVADFAGVRAGGGHALIALNTDRGLYALEPQASDKTFALVPWSEFPNRDTVFRIL